MTVTEIADEVQAQVLTAVQTVQEAWSAPSSG